MGTSGYSYKEWKGSFYPEDLAAAKMLSYYAERLPSVEINNTFYRMPKPEVLERWRDSVPDDFRFVLKAPQRISHRHRLKDAEDSVRYLIETSRALGEKRGPFLIQLPPFLRKDSDRLESFLEIWPEEARVAFEFRHPSWFDDDVRALLEKAGAALCIADSGTDKDAPFWSTTDWGYLRLRRADYEQADLERWASDVGGQNWSETYGITCSS